MNELVKENRNKKIVVTHLDGYVRFLPNKKLYMDSILKLDLNTRIEPKALVEKLLNIGYKRETIVTTTGEIGVRGFVIDIYPLGENHPVRLEFFGDEIDSIRYFDEATQRSIKEIKSIKILPNTEDIFETGVNKEHKFLSVENTNIGNIEDYLTNPNFFYKDINQLNTAYKKLEEDAFNYKQEKDKLFPGKYFLDFKALYHEDGIKYYTIDNYIQDKNTIYFDSKEIPDFHGDVELVDSYIKKMLLHKKTICICVSKNTCLVIYMKQL